MHTASRNSLFSVIVLITVMMSCQSPTKPPAADPNEQVASAEKENVKATFERILIAVGNRDAKELSSLSYDKAVIGYTYLQDGAWANKEVTLQEYVQKMAEATDPKPISEIAKSYTISITEGRIALLVAETVISQFGVPRNGEVNHATFMKENNTWKLLGIAWTVHPLPEEEKKFDLDLFAQSYAQVWCSQKPEFVAMFFEENGSLQVNDGTPATGREAISRVAQSFMSQFPDLKVSFDSLSNDGDRTKFHWTLTGTDASPGGKGNKVKISGYELWEIGSEGRIRNSQGYFSTDEYNKQLQFERAN